MKQGEGKDPWKHRSAMMSCASCMWFVAKVAKENGELRKQTAELAQKIKLM